MKAADIPFGAPSSAEMATFAPTPGWPAPLRAAAYHGVLGSIVQTVAPQTEADPAAVLLQLLAMFGSVLGRGPHFRVGASRHGLNLFVAVVGDTSNARKGMSLTEAKRAIKHVDPEWSERCVTSGLSSGEGLIWAVRDAIELHQAVKNKGRVVDYETVVEDPGVSDKRLFVVEAEMASALKVMAREGNTLSAVVRQAWDGDDLRRLTKTSPARATAPHISIVAHITQAELRRYLSATEMANGFGNRFAWACARRSRELPDGGAGVDLSGQVAHLRDAVAFAANVGELRRDTEARRLWHRVYGALSCSRPGMLGAMTARAEAQVMRVACLYALADLSSVVAARHLRAALEVWRYCQASAAYLFADRLGDTMADDIHLALKGAYPASVTRSFIVHDVFKRNKSAHEIERALQLLKQHGLANCKIDHTGEGRPTERWFLVDQVMDDFDDFDDLTEAANGPSVVNVVNVVAGPKDEVGQAVC